MNQESIRISGPTRAEVIKRGRYLEYFPIGYNSLEGLIAVGAGVLASSIALVGFGFDSLIEVTSGAVLLWRLYVVWKKTGVNLDANPVAGTHMDQINGSRAVAAVCSRFLVIRFSLA